MNTRRPGFTITMRSACFMFCLSKPKDLPPCAPGYSRTQWPAMSMELPDMHEAQRNIRQKQTTRLRSRAIALKRLLSRAIGARSEAMGARGIIAGLHLSACARHDSWRAIHLSCCSGFLTHTPDGHHGLLLRDAHRHIARRRRRHALARQHAHAWTEVRAWPAPGA